MNGRKKYKGELHSFFSSEIREVEKEIDKSSQRCYTNIAKKWCL
jgi:hypothetical protein